MKCENCGFFSFEEADICIACGKPLLMNQHRTNEEDITERCEKNKNVDSSISSHQVDLNKTLESIKKSLDEIIIDDSQKKPSNSYSPERLTLWVTKSLPKGGFFIRLVAFIIDQTAIFFSSIPFILIGTFAVVLNYSTTESKLLEKLFEIITIPYFFLLVILSMLYHTYFTGAYGRTLGKLCCGLKVIQVNGESVSYGQAFLRWVGYLVSSFFFYLGYLWILFDPYKQGWHDKIAQTYVVKNK